MTRNEATKLLRAELDKYGLEDWHIRLVTDQVKYPVLGLCSYKDKTIILSAHHIDQHPDPEITNTIRHEVAHALVGSGHSHDDVWKAKAIEIGCDNTSPCASYALSVAAIDAIRSGAQLEITFEERTIREPKFKIHKLQDHCPVCNKVAEELFSVVTVDKDGNDVKLITLKCFHVLSKTIPKATPFQTLVSNGWKPHVRDCHHLWNKNQCTLCLEYRPFPFQVEGMRALERGLALHKGFALFDEQGLGKTVQGLGWLKYHPEGFPFLWAGKSGIKYQYFKEIWRWLGPDYPIQIIESARQGVLPGLKGYIVSYDLLRRLDSSKIKSLGIKTLILDEVQHVKNPDASRTAEIRNIARSVDNIIPLSGTPWKNRGSEFFVVLNLLDATKFPSFEGFKNRWVDYYWDGYKYKEGGIRNIKAFREYISDLAIRRERTEVMPELPLVSRNKLYAKMDGNAQRAYDIEVDDFVNFWNQAVISGEENTLGTHQGVMQRLVKMRQITGMAKVPVTLEFAQEFLDDTERKLVIFVHHISVGQMLHTKLSEYCANNDYPQPLQLTGGMDSFSRSEVQQQFNEGPARILIASTLASGEGLNLQSCSDCIMHERQWNPANEEQAEGRFIRIGQQANVVTATYALAEGSVDAHLDGIIEMKRNQFHSTMNKGEMPAWNEQNIVRELAQAIVNTSKGKKVA